MLHFIRDFKTDHRYFLYENKFYWTVFTCLDLFCLGKNKKSHIQRVMRSCVKFQSVSSLNGVENCLKRVNFGL